MEGKEEKRALTQFRELLVLLAGTKVHFIVVGGVAASLHGSSRLTSDLDVVYSRNAQNLERLVASLQGHGPYLRGAPPGLPFRLDEATLRSGLNFTLKTDLGDIDILGEITGGGSYEDLLPHSVEMQIFGFWIRCLDLDTLICVKRAAGRPRDFDAIAELELIRQERGKLDR